MSNTAKWVTGIIVVIIILLGAWWLMGMQSNNANGLASNTASSTDETATTTSETSGAGSIATQNSTGTVSQVIAGLGLGSRYAGLLSQTGVGSGLTGAGPYTVFVATDGAFARLPAGTISSMSASDLKRMMQYSVVSGKKIDADAVNNGQIQALSKDTINFNVDEQHRVYVNSGYVLQAYNASNGIVYVINSVLIPPTKTQ
jgi:uncharacterized surface protein with fasciclin (FAS1) repeats